VTQRTRWLVTLSAVAIVFACDQRFVFDSPTFAASDGSAGVAGTSNQKGTPDAAGAAACAGGCANWGQVCAPDWQICVECNADSDCQGTRATCGHGALLHRCVECRGDDESACAWGTKCDDPTGRCVDACHEDDDGTIDDHFCPTGSICAGSAGICASCADDSSCENSPAGPRCHPTLRECTGCAHVTDCKAPKAFCDPTILACVGCRDGRDCSSGVCDAVTHACR
jgi:hypothetical protein